MLFFQRYNYLYQRWSPRGRPWSRRRPRGHILKSLALASKPQVLENCPVLGSKTALFLNRWNFVGKRQKPCGKSAKTFFLVSSRRDRLKKIFWKPFSPEKNFEDLFFFDIAWKKFLRTFYFYFLESTCVCVLGFGLERVCRWPWPQIFFVSLASSLVSSTPLLICTVTKACKTPCTQRGTKVRND